MQMIRKLGHYFKDTAQHIDFTIMITYIILSLTGLIMIYSASMVMAMHEEHGNPALYFFGQLRYVIIGFLLVVTLIFFKPDRILRDRRLHLFMIVGIFFALLLTHFFGVEISGRKRWLELPIGGRFQPSEFLKIIVILYLAYIYDQKRSKLLTMQVGNFTPLILVSAISFIVLFNDFGTWLLITAIIGGMFVYSGFPLKIMFKAAGFVVVVLSSLVGIRYLITGEVLSGYQRARIETYMNPFLDPEGAGMQLTNSLIAISHGGITGTGLGNGVMKLGYLPEPHTDFIFAVIAEELGLIGVIMILFLFMIIVFKAFYYAYQSSDQFYSLLCVGIAIYIGVQLFLNLGGISGLIPLTGIPLPLLSQGGSSFLSISIAIGLLMIAAKHVKRERGIQRAAE